MKAETTGEPMVGLNDDRALLRRTCGGEHSPVPREFTLAAIHEESASRADQAPSPHNDVLPPAAGI